MLPCWEYCIELYVNLLLGFLTLMGNALGVSSAVELRGSMLSEFCINFVTFARVIPSTASCNKKLNKRQRIDLFPINMIQDALEQTGLVSALYSDQHLSALKKNELCRAVDLTGGKTRYVRAQGLTGGSCRLCAMNERSIMKRQILICHDVFLQHDFTDT